MRLFPRFVYAALLAAAWFCAAPCVAAQDFTLTLTGDSIITQRLAVYQRDARFLAAVSAVREGDAAFEFEVRDNGPGIPSEYHEVVFEMFRTLRPRDEIEGSGIGLALVKKTIENHGGDVRVESPGDGGLRVMFTWPKKLSW